MSLVQIVIFRPGLRWLSTFLDTIRKTLRAERHCLTSSGNTPIVKTNEEQADQISSLSGKGLAKGSQVEG